MIDNPSSYNVDEVKILIQKKYFDNLDKMSD
jgi:hypothetical protein